MVSSPPKNSLQLFACPSCGGDLDPQQLAQKKACPYCGRHLLVNDTTNKLLSSPTATEFIEMNPKEKNLDSSTVIKSETVNSTAKKLPISWVWLPLFLFFNFFFGLSYQEAGWLFWGGFIPSLLFTAALISVNIYYKMVTEKKR